MVGPTDSAEQREEDAPRTSAEARRALIEHVGAGVVIHAPDESILLANDRACELLGVSRAQIVGKNASDPGWRFYREDGTVMPVDELPVRQVIASRKPLSGWVVGIDRPQTGDRAWVVVSAYPDLDDDELREVVVTFVDITEARRAEGATRRSEEKYRLLFDSMLDGFALHEVVFDEDGKPSDYLFLEVNRAFERLTGLSADAVVGRRVTEILPGISADPADWIGRYGEVALSGRQIRFEQYSQPLDKWYSVLAFRPRDGQFATIFEDISARKRAEREMRIKDAFFEGALAAHSIADASGRVTLVNDAFLRLWGYESTEQAIGSRVGDLFAKPEDADSVLRTLDETGSWQGEFVAARRRGERFTSRGYASVIRDDQSGQIVGYQSTNLDVSAEHDAAQRIQHLNRVLRAVRRIAQLITQEKDPARLIDRACALLVETRGFQGAWLVVGAPGDHPDRWAEAGLGEAFGPFAQSLEAGRWPAWCAPLWEAAEGVTSLRPNEGDGPYPVDVGAESHALVAVLRHQDRAHGLLGVSFHGDLKADEEELDLLGEVAGDLAFALHTISVEHEGRMAADALEASVARQRNLFEAVSDSLFLIDNLTGRIQEANGAAAVLYGYSIEELLGMRNTDLSAEPEDTRAATKAPQIYPGEHVTIPLRWHRKKDGTVFPVEISALFHEVDGRMVHLASIRDISDRVRAEEERRALQATLAQSDRLSSMGMLAAGVAHEINNPLTYVLYHLETLSRDLRQYAREVGAARRALTKRFGEEALQQSLGAAGATFDPALWDDVQERFHEALEGTRKIKEIARGLGTFSRVESDKLAPVDLRRAIASAVSIAHNEIKYRAQLVQDLAVTAPILGSEGRLSQVFLNLLVNAAHAIREGDVEHNRIGVRTWEEDGNVVAEVEDTGSGMSPEHLERIFEPFFTTKPPGVGSGLGLAIVQGIVTGYDGTIEIESEVGKGTRFVIRFPALADEAGLEPARQRGAERPAPSASGRILVIDDEPSIRNALRRVLHGHEIVEAGSGERARAILEADQRFDVILCDMMMPEMSGMDLHRWLEEDKPELARRLVFVTGGAFTPHAKEYLDRVANLRVDKPFDATNLQKLVAQWVLAARNDSA